MSRAMRQLASDVGSGFVAFLIVRFLPIVTGQHQDIRPFVLTTFLAFLSASFYRNLRTRTRWLSASLGVALGGVTPGVMLRLLGMSLTVNAFFVLFLTTALFAVTLGAILSPLSLGNRRNTAILTGLLAAAAATVLAYRTIPGWLDRRAFQAVNQIRPAFDLHTLEGRTVKSDDLRGHVVVLSFWATWCLPCQAELPRIAAISKHYSGNPKVLILAVASGTEGDTAQKVHSYLCKRHLDVPVLIDSADGNASGPAANSLAVPSLPALYILDPSGHLRSIHLGYEASEDLEDSLPRQIDKLL